MIKKENYFKFFSGILGILFLLVFLETILQVYSYVFLKPNIYKIKKNPHERIVLTFGESTTETRYDKNKIISWPEQFEEMLNEYTKDSLYKYKVLNFGKSATRSILIKENIFQMVEKYSPETVILMMGTNDNTSLEFLNPIRFWQKAKLVKIYHWIVHSYYVPRLPNIDKTRIIHQFVDDIDVTLSEVVVIKKIEEIKSKLDKKDHWFLFRELSAKFFLKSLSVDNINHSRLEVSKYLKRARTLIYLAFDNKNYDQNVLRLVSMTADPNDLSSREFALGVIVEALEKKIEVDSATLSMMIGNYSKCKNYKKLQELSGFTIGSTRPVEVVKKNYQEIARFLISKKIKLYVMSYPTTNIDVFKSMFDHNLSYDSDTMSSYFYRSLPNVKISTEFQDVKFISNENFNLIKDLYKEGYVFKDLFATWLGGKFGHTTEYGHKLIAKNVFDSFRNDIKADIKADVK